MSRLFNNSTTPSAFHSILSKESCNINKYDFLQKLDAVKYSRIHLDDGTQKSDAKNKKLWDTLSEMCHENSESLEVFEQAILQTIFYISEDPAEFLKENHVIVFTLILLQDLKKQLSIDDGTVPMKNSLKELFMAEDGLRIGHMMIPKELLQNILDRLPDLKTEIEGKSLQNCVTMYQLLDGYKKLDSSRVFKWRQKNKKMPNFFSEYLVNKYGHKEKLTYMNYLKESRPNMAFSILCRQNEKPLSSFSSKM